MSSKNISSECILAEETIANWPMTIVLVSVVFLDAISIFLLIIYGNCYRNNKALHPNIKALKLSLIFCLILRNTLTMLRACRMLFATFTGKQNPCFLLTPKYVCGIESIINASPIEVVDWMFCVITLERIAATLFHKKYENFRCTFLSLSCAIFPWIFQIIHIIPKFVTLFEGPNDLMPYCSSISSKAYDIFVIFGYLLPVVIVNIILCFIILLFNSRAQRYDVLKTRDGGNFLTAKFQRLENISVTRIMTLHCIVFLLFHIANVYMIVLIQNANLTSLPMFAFYKEASGLTFPIHGNVYVILGLIMSRKIRMMFYKNKFIQIFVCRKSERELSNIPANVVAPLAERDDYFRMYRQQWN